MYFELTIKFLNTFFFVNYLKIYLNLLIYANINDFTWFMLLHGFVEKYYGEIILLSN